MPLRSFEEVGAPLRVQREDHLAVGLGLEGVWLAKPALELLVVVDLAVDRQHLRADRRSAAAAPRARRRRWPGARGPGSPCPRNRCRSSPAHGGAGAWTGPARAHAAVPDPTSARRSRVQNTWGPAIVLVGATMLARPRPSSQGAIAGIRPIRPDLGTSGPQPRGRTFRVAAVGFWRGRGRHAPRRGHLASPVDRSNPQKPSMPTWHSAKSYRTGSPGSRRLRDAVMSDAMRQPSLL